MPNPNPVGGAPSEAEAQGTALFTLQNAAAADGNGSIAPTDGFGGAQMLELQKTGAGTTTLNVEGSMDGTVWYAAGYQVVDATAAPARAVAGIAVGAGSVSHVYQILDRYPLIRSRLSATAGAVVVTTKLYAIPLT